MKSQKSENYFWNDIPEVRRIFLQVQSGIMDLNEAAFQLGVSVADLKHRVGPLVPGLTKMVRA